jgi:PAS domain S-box-containing protein
MEITTELDAAVYTKDRQKVLRIFDEAIPAGNDLISALQEFRDLVFNTARERAALTLDSTTRTIIAIVVLTAVFVLFSLFLLLFTIKDLRTPLVKLETAVMEITKGNLSYPVRDERRDELGILSDCIGDMVDKIFEQIKTNEFQLTKLNLVVQASKIGLWDMEVVEDDPVNPLNKFNWSDQFRSMLGYSDEKDFPNLLSSWSDLLHSDDKEITLNCFMNHLIDRTGRTPYDVEYQLLKRNGEYGYFHAYGETIRKKNGNAIRVAGALKDITEEKRIAFEMAKRRDETEAELEELVKKRSAELQHTMEKLEIASHAKSSFLANMSHEIRTPMNAILGVTEILMQDENHTPGTLDGLQRIHNSGDLLLSIINDILDLSKIEAGKMDLVYNDYHVASLINDTVSLNIMRIGSKPIEFELYVNEKLPLILNGDELRIKQILNNLLSNAFKYTKKGTVKLSVSFEREHTDSDEILLIFTVKDSGQGMSEEQVNKLFDEYSRFNEEANSTTEGTGLGMSITQKLLFIMNGDIDVRSELDKGSEFFISMPQKCIGTEELGKELAENLQKFKSKSLESPIRKLQIVYEPMPYGRVLVVDDVESNLFVAQGLMKPYDLNVETASSGYDAIDKIKEGNEYDVVFMDHMMPNMDGIETVKHIREWGYTQPIVALTANAVVGQSEVFLANGFDGFISKPIDTRELNAALKKFVRDKQPPELIEAAQQAAARKSSEAAAKAAEQTPAAPTDTWKKIEQIEGLQTEKGLESFLGQHDGYEKTLKLLIKEIEKCSKNLAAFLSADDMHNFAIDVHGMKGSLANIGAMEISDLAKELEFAAKDANSGFCTSNLPPFLEKLQTFKQKLIEAFAEEKQNQGIIEIPPELPPIFEKLTVALGETDYLAIDRGMESLDKLNLSLGTEPKHGALKDEIEQIKDAVMMLDYESALNMMRKLLE